MTNDKIVIRGARQHNLKSIDLEIPRNQLVVMTGLSGSGKSSLALDTIYAEGQRRYVESLSAYARQFLGRMDKPDVDSIDGLSPAISIDQKTTSHNPRSTVGTVTEIHDFLRLLYARVGEPHCPNCHRPIQRQTIDQVVDQVLTLPEGSRVMVLAPMVRGRKGEHERVFAELAGEGLVRARVDGRVIDLADPPQLNKKTKHQIEAVVDRLVIADEVRSRLADSLETAMTLAHGLAVVAVVDGAETTYSQNFACPDCGISLEELTPRMFSFNNPYGACSGCDGLGYHLQVDPALVVPDERRSLAGGAVAPWARSEYYSAYLTQAAQHFGIPTDRPWRELGPEQKALVMEGTRQTFPFHFDSHFGRRRKEIPFSGVASYVQRRHREAMSEEQRREMEAYMTPVPCPECSGQRLRKESLAVTVGGISIAEFSAMAIQPALDFVEGLTLGERQETIAREIKKTLIERLGFLINVGLEYLTLDRAAMSLSGGEAQRIRLATQIGAGLVGVIYVLDEPSIGLHPRDNRRLVDTLKRLRDQGNTLIVIEHDEETMRSADYIVDIGPGAGREGGYVVSAGTPAEVMADPRSLTGSYLAGRRSVPLPSRRRPPGPRSLVVRQARAHNLKGIDVRFPLGLLIGVTGVSGSGKSSLVNDVLYRALARDLNRAHLRPAEHGSIEGLEYLEKVIDIDQSPIGRTPRSNPATYTGLFDLVRGLFAGLPEAKMRGYGPGRFSFNVPGGRCEACRGDGIIKIEMHFLPDVYVPCEVCRGMRYNRETLEVTLRKKTIADVLNLTVDEAIAFFQPYPRLARKLAVMAEVGLGYVTLGQSATTLSGGEAQRVKLAAELSRQAVDGTFYILDEPTTGLHMDDVRRLLEVLQRLVDYGSTVVVIEHNLDVIKSCDWIIDLGPEGGDRGGRLVAEGPPETLATHPHSYTGHFLAAALASQESLAGA